MLLEQTYFNSLSHFVQRGIKRFSFVSGDLLHSPRQENRPTIKPSHKYHFALIGLYPASSQVDRPEFIIIICEPPKRF